MIAKLLLGLLLCVGLHGQGVSLAWSAQSYTSSVTTKAPWCPPPPYPPWRYAEHLLTSSQSWSYGISPALPIRATEKDEWYYYDNSVHRQLMGYTWHKDVWTYPTYVQAPSQASRAHTSNDGSGNYTDNDSSEKCWPEYRQAHLTSGYPEQSCGSVVVQTVDINGREYMMVANGSAGSLFKAWIHLETSIDSVSGLAYAGNFFRVNTSNGAGFKGTTALFDVNGDAVLYILGSTLYDVTPSFKDGRGQFNFTYTVTGTHVEEK